MQQIFNFVIKNKTFLLFLFLFGISLAFTIQSHSYHRSKFISSANGITGGVYGMVNSVDKYFGLEIENSKLAEENKRLRQLLLNLQINADSSFLQNKENNNLNYVVRTAEVFKNSYASPNNYLTINKGEKDSIYEDFGVITPKGIVGIIDNTSNNYSRVISILNKKSRINAKLKNSNHIGSLEWNGKSPEFSQLTDVSKFADVKIGDTIETGGESAIFPKGIGIGTIESFQVDITGDTYNIEIRLFNDMTNVGTVYVIENKDRKEILELENSDE
ncbi:MAG: rod shape-determining protein MreC [Winogradskyella sp.]|uniref:rod shape-determining protein MreC n=1 Tax=Winogradskyella sp. TaxID=1883156 RepID=UPI0025E56600|nr:rod shape-determining protein MreC [Winogradskyella sp.]NRB59984.1 rod shape-determining protein MreC [Winogradskyella sp.]